MAKYVIYRGYCCLVSDENKTKFFLDMPREFYKEYDLFYGVARQSYPALKKKCQPITKEVADIMRGV